MIDEACSRNGVSHACGLDHAAALHEELKIALNLGVESEVVGQTFFLDSNDFSHWRGEVKMSFRYVIVVDVLTQIICHHTVLRSC